MYLCIRVWKKNWMMMTRLSHTAYLEFSNIYDFVRWKNKETEFALRIFLNNND
jgi:hypothetical protein